MSIDISKNDVPTISELVDAALERGAASSYRDLARQLKVHNTTLREWKSERAHPKNDVAIRLARLCGRDPCEVLAIVNYWRSKPADRIYIRRMLQYIRAGLAACFLLFITDANTLHAMHDTVQKNTASIHYTRYIAPA
ncbi:MAG: helix-turn-helix transcriptional regulator [Thalassobaculaceae bacterium]